LIIPLHAANPGAFTGSGNWTYLLIGKRTVLIDAGVGERSHLEAIAAHVPEGPAHVIVTHAHPDHADGAAVLGARWPNARFWKMPWPDRDMRYAVEWNSLSDGQIVPAGDDSLEVVHTPGHAPDHICLWQRSSSTLFSADLFVKGGTVVIPPSAEGDLTQYLDSLARVNALGPARMLPAHGPQIDDPPAIIREYLEHRRLRERQVLNALESGCTNVEQITDRIYIGLPTALVVMARESVLAHLLKLEREGAVRQRQGGWSYTDAT
jgi:glyoxylase-like metal-dependent hydrolase (beta-lactamase superfamily II)